MTAPDTLPLRDLALPPDIGWWPPAPGWWLAAAGILGLALLCTLYRAHRHRLRIRRAAARSLAEIEAAWRAHRDDVRLAAELSMLCRRIQMVLAPQAGAAVGESRLAALDALGGGEFFCAGAGRVLSDAPYRREIELDAAALCSGVARWITRLPPLPIRRGAWRV